MTTLILLHVPRTGGTTAAKRLQAAFLHSRQVGPNYDQGYKEATAQLERKARVISSHFPFGAHEKLKGPYEYATILRDPVDRVKSAYGWYTSGRVSSHRYHEVTQREGISGMVKEAVPLQNGMVKVLSGVSLATESVGKDHLKTAIENLDREVKHVGFTGSLDLFLDSLTKHLGLPGGGRSRINVTGSTLLQFTAEEIATVRQYNRWDQALYEHARRVYG